MPNLRHAPALALTPGAAAATVLWSLLYGGPLGEEPGWRGHALPELLARTDPLRASVLLGVAWGLWHLPLHVIGTYDAALPVHPPLLVALTLRVGSSVALSIVFTWLFLRTDGNLLLAVTLHLAANLSTGWLLPVGAGTSMGLILLAALLAVQGHLWRPQPGRATPVIVR